MMINDRCQDHLRLRRHCRRRRHPRMPMALMAMMAMTTTVSLLLAVDAAAVEPCRELAREAAKQSPSYKRCKAQCGFSVEGPGTRGAKLRAFCSSVDCLRVYRLLVAADGGAGTQCLLLGDFKTLALDDIKNAERCFGYDAAHNVSDVLGGTWTSLPGSSSASAGTSASGSGGGGSATPAPSKTKKPTKSPTPEPSPTPPTPTPTPTPSEDSASRSEEPKTKHPKATPKALPSSTSTATATVSPSATEETATAHKSSSGLDTGSLVGIIGASIGVVAVLGALLFAARYTKKNRKRNQERRKRKRLQQATSDDGGMLGHDPDAPGGSAAVGDGNLYGPLASTSSKSMWSHQQQPPQQLTATGSGGSSTNGLRQTSMTVTDDEIISAARIPYEKIVFRELLSRGGFGEVYVGTYRNEVVAIKSLLPEHRNSMRQIQSFLSEVRMMATMDHERIVRFIGVAWDSLNELCVVSEFMERGDLRTALTQFEEQRQRPHGFDADKVKIALHVAHALTYLHSLQLAVLHRDLKSRNILLHGNLDAKLTDFGVSRERADRTMTAGVGSSLWMAPEVMIGERYDEKADVFSFGVVLSELDTHLLPYSHAVESGTGRKLPDTAILQMVSLGRLQADFTNIERSPMAKLGLDCVSLDPDRRPTSAEALHRIHQLWRRYNRA